MAIARMVMRTMSASYVDMFQPHSFIINTTHTSCSGLPSCCSSSKHLFSGNASARPGRTGDNRGREVLARFPTCSFDTPLLTTPSRSPLRVPGHRVYCHTLQTCNALGTDSCMVTVGCFEEHDAGCRSWWFRAESLRGKWDSQEFL